MSETPAGWYPTPDGRQGYWDGHQWTEHTADRHGLQPSAQMSSASATQSPQAVAGGPSTSPPVRPAYRKKRFLIPVALVGVIVVGSALAGLGEDAAPTAEASPSTSATRKSVV